MSLCCCSLRNDHIRLKQFNVEVLEDLWNCAWEDDGTPVDEGTGWDQLTIQVNRVPTR